MAKAKIIIELTYLLIGNYKVIQAKKEEKSI